MEKLNKTRAFLTEFIIVILFFSVAAVITMELYAEANNMNNENGWLSDSVIHTQSVAEKIKAGVIYYNDEGIYTKYLNEDMEYVEKEQAFFEEKVIVSILGSEIENDAGTLYSYDIVIDNIDSGKEIYSLNVRQYVSKEVQ
ncbi:MAG: hypothetical protein IJP13_05190 [Lachnospiraceae bacterium]|nr:hypothetical protein [Lachnospiraceae bacterium]